MVKVWERRDSALLWARNSKLRYCHMAHIRVNHGSYMGHIGQPWVNRWSFVSYTGESWDIYGSRGSYNWSTVDHMGHMRVNHGSYASDIGQPLIIYVGHMSQPWVIRVM
mgnify:CR=1 FL=1